MKIFKYELLPKSEIVLWLPKGAQLLSVQTQNSIPCLWAMVDPNAKLEERRLRFAGTGHFIEPGEYKFIDTFQMGSLVFHVLEIL